MAVTAMLDERTATRGATRGTTPGSAQGPVQGSAQGSFDPRVLPRAVGGLLTAARQGLADAEGAQVAGERYALAHLAALRAAAAVLAARTRPLTRRLGERHAAVAERPAIEVDQQQRRRVPEAPHLVGPLAQRGAIVRR